MNTTPRILINIIGHFDYLHSIMFHFVAQLKGFQANAPSYFAHMADTLMDMQVIIRNLQIFHAIE